MPTCANMCHYVPTWANIAVCSCAQKQSLFVSMAQASPKAGARELSYNSLNLTHEFRPLFSPNVIFTGLLRKAFPQKHAFVDMSVFLWLRKQRSRFAQGQTKGYFQMKELDRTTEAIVPMNEMWRKLNANMRQYVQLRANMGQHCSLSAVHRKASYEEQS